MRIKRLDIVGFKSFADKVTLVFDKPIVGVVGPNGCGKSNIVDAIRWAMGEQSVKALRGNARDDVIFSGTESRAAQGLSEVTLVFDNADGRAPAQYAAYAEISVTRRLFRDGESEYLLNGAPCRLRDITDLFLGTGAGSKAYSIIEQGHVARILSAKPEDRRLFIEEAAGITKYHARKREAERKMESTKQNLLRIGDILGELKKQLDSLSRQANKATRYRDYKIKLQQLDMSFASHDYNAAIDRMNVLAGRIEELSETELGQSAQAEALENDISAKSLAVSGREQELADQQDALSRLEQQIRLDERNLEVFAEETKRLAVRAEEIARERDGIERDAAAQGELVARLEDEQRAAVGQAQQAETALAGAKSQLQERETAFNREAAEVERLKRSIFEAMSEFDRVEHQQETLRHRVRDNEERSARNRAEHKDAEARFEALDQQRRGFAEGLGGLKQLKLTLDARRGEQADQLKRDRETYLDLEERLAAERDRLTAVRSRHDSLAELDNALEGFAEAVKTVIADAGRFQKGELVDVLARLVKVDPQHELAAAAALGEKLQWVVVEDANAAKKGVAFLSERNAGRAGFLPDVRRAYLCDHIADAKRPLVRIHVRFNRLSGHRAQHDHDGPRAALARFLHERLVGREDPMDIRFLQLFDQLPVIFWTFATA
ncbi:MAG: hypothetical protein C4523_11340 [Myxococcales bacterium]|nr:MAG: hypothetical protein C4523_11340 [Myxococcales bacterium]